MANELEGHPKMRTFIETFAEEEFARELCRFIEDYSIIGPGIAGTHVVEGLEGVARILRELGWAQE